MFGREIKKPIKDKLKQTFKETGVGELQLQLLIEP